MNYRIFILMIALIGVVHARGTQHFVALVESLYKSYSWSVVFAIAPKATAAVPLQDESAKELAKYFTNDMVQALVKDAECRKRTREICKIGSDMLFDSQDPQASDLVVELKHSMQVHACFKERAIKKCVRLFGEQTATGPKICDIRYGTDGSSSLRVQLALPISTKRCNEKIKKVPASN